MNPFLVGLVIIVLLLLATLALGLLSRVLTGHWAGGPYPANPQGGSVDLASFALRGAEVEIRELRPGAARPMARLAGEVEQRSRVAAEPVRPDPIIGHPRLTFIGLR